MDDGGRHKVRSSGSRRAGAGGERDLRRDTRRIKCDEHQFVIPGPYRAGKINNKHVTKPPRVT